MEEKLGEGLATRTIDDLEFEYNVQDWLGVDHSILDYGSRKTKTDGDDQGMPTMKGVFMKVRKSLGHDLKERVVVRAVEIHGF